MINSKRSFFNFKIRIIKIKQYCLFKDLKQLTNLKKRTFNKDKKHSFFFLLIYIK